MRCSAQGIINCNGTETFAKEPKLAKLLREQSRRSCRATKWTAGFSHMSVMGNFLVLGALLCDDL